MRPLSFFWWLLACLLVLDGVCLAAPSAEPSATGASERAQAALDRAISHYEEGRLAEAAGLLRGFLVSYADSGLSGEAYRVLASVHADLDEPELALGYLVKLPPGQLRPGDRLLKGRLQIRRGAVAEGVTILRSLDSEPLTLAQRQERALLLAAGLAEQEQAQPALYFLYQALLIEGSLTPEDVLARVDILMDAQMTDAELAEASFMYRGTSVALLAKLKLGWRALASGRKAAARDLVSQVLEGPPGFVYRDEALTLLSQLTDPTQLQRAIGVMLPLSGRYAAFGKLVQRGMEQARADFRPEVPVRFLYRDTAGDPELAARQVAELAIGERVMALAGPLVGSAAAAAAERAGREQVPLLTLSQKEGLAAASPYVFRNSLTAHLQVEALADFAMNEQGLVTFGILYPDSRQGRIMADLFRAAVMQRGGEVVAVQSYQEQQTDFRRQVRLLQGLDPNAPDEEETTDDAAAEGVEEEEEPPPFEALFLPDYADRVSLIAPQLPFYGLEGVQLLGTNGWNDPQLVKAAGKFVEGAVFVDGFFRHSPYPFVQDFVASYFATHGEEPTILEAQGYDVAGILLTLLDDPRMVSRAAVRWGLAQMPIFPGVTGATRFDAQGEADKTLFLLQIQDGIIVQVN